MGARELICKTGLYNKSINKVIYLSEDEFDESLNNSKTELMMGESKKLCMPENQKIIKRYLVWAEKPGCLTVDHLFLPTVKNCLKKSVLDLILKLFVIEV